MIDHKLYRLLWSLYNLWIDLTDYTDNEPKPECGITFIQKLVLSLEMNMEQSLCLE